MWFYVIPAKAGIQFFQIVKNYLDSGFHRSDDLNTKIDPFSSSVVPHGA
jgi:hypothetical protein